jgi:hypothetical protein
MNATRRQRVEKILLAYIRALNGRWPWHTNLAEVLQGDLEHGPRSDRDRTQRGRALVAAAKPAQRR